MARYGRDAGVLNAGLREVSELLTRAIRDGARSTLTQAELAQRYAELVRTFTQRPEPKR